MSVAPLLAAAPRSTISDFFVGRPRFAIVLSLVILLAGLVALPLLPIAEYPEVVPPTVVVRTAFPGADPAVIAETVASPLEQAINGVEGMLYQSSQSSANHRWRRGSDGQSSACS